MIGPSWVAGEEGKAMGLGRRLEPCGRWQMWNPNPS
uniref:Uncharacterized protein n=1 Tax=Arundo donax TaxID=35708 RepID=A0A0A9GFW3_ARUDO